MSSLKKQNRLIFMLAMLTLAFSSLSIYEFVQVNNLNNEIKSIKSSQTTVTSTSFATITGEITGYLPPPQTITITSTTTFCPVPSLQGDRGFIEIETYNRTRILYAYMKLNESSLTTSKLTFYNVTFNRWTNPTITNTFGSCYGGVGGYGGYVIVFQDGSFENMSTCTAPSPYPQVDIRLTKHTNPQAGFLIIPQSDTFYFLVSV